MAVKLRGHDVPDLDKTSSDPGQPQRTGEGLLPGPLAPPCQASYPVSPFAKSFARLPAPFWTSKGPSLTPKTYDFHDTIVKNQCFVNFNKIDFWDHFWPP